MKKLLFFIVSINSFLSLSAIPVEEMKAPKIELTEDVLKDSSKFEEYYRETKQSLDQKQAQWEQQFDAKAKSEGKDLLDSAVEKIGDPAYKAALDGQESLESLKKIQSAIMSPQVQETQKNNFILDAINEGNKIDSAVNKLEAKIEELSKSLAITEVIVNPESPQKEGSEISTELTSEKPVVFPTEQPVTQSVEQPTKTSSSSSIGKWWADVVSGIKNFFKNLFTPKEVITLPTGVKAEVYSKPVRNVQDSLMKRAAATTALGRNAISTELNDSIKASSKEAINSANAEMDFAPKAYDAKSMFADVSSSLESAKAESAQADVSSVAGDMAKASIDKIQNDALKEIAIEQVQAILGSEDPYELLNVKQSASGDEIFNSFSKKINAINTQASSVVAALTGRLKNGEITFDVYKKSIEDLAPGNDALFKIVDAYNILSGTYLAVDPSRLPQNRTFALQVSPELTVTLPIDREFVNNLGTEIQEYFQERITNPIAYTGNIASDFSAFKKAVRASLAK